MNVFKYLANTWNF